MTGGRRSVAAALCLASLLAGAQPADDAPRRLIEQKLRLVEATAASAAAQEAAQRARAALEGNRLDEAGAALDEALRNAGRAGARSAPPPAAARASFDGLREQIATYRMALEELARQGSGEAGGIATRLGALRSEAETLAAGGRLADANRKLSDAYGLAVQALVRLRAGQTVTQSLHFETPAEEYAYERRRFRSSEMLVDMMLGEGRADGERVGLVGELLREARALAAAAADKAGGGDHGAAVAAMEAAAARLNRALQLMGVPVF